jgi:tetratricopeptide (TPR) repeat protein
MRHPFRLIRLLSASLLLLGGSGFAEAQQARIAGQVRTDAGEPIKGATIRGENPDETPGVVTVKTDKEGRFAVFVTRGRWAFVGWAPGYEARRLDLDVPRLSATYPDLVFMLPRADHRPDGVDGLTAKELQRRLREAEALLGQQKYEDAIRAYRDILAKAPSFAVVNLEIGEAYRNLKQYDQAIAAYEALLSIEPDNTRAVIDLALTHADKGDEQAAEQVLRHGADASGDSEVFYALAELTAKHGRPDEAATWYQKAAEADPAWGKPLYKLGALARARGDRQAAISAMAKVIEVDPGSSEAAQAKIALDELKQ